MPRYAPQSLPVGGSRPPVQQAVNASDTEEPTSPDHGQPAVLLGQHIRRERGMQGVQRYVVSMREHLTESEYGDLCHAMGVPTDLQLPAQTRSAASQPVSQVQDPPFNGHQQAPNLNNNNNMQMMQTLMQMMSGMNGMGGMGGMGGAPAGGTGGGTGGMNMNGMNPLLLAQMLQGGMGNANSGGGMNGMNPLLLAQMLSSMQQR